VRIGETVEFAERWLARGVCPGCRAPLVDVAGQGDGHDSRDGSLFYGGGGGSFAACEWGPDQLSALVHVGAGLVQVR
jgi:hypothetical protein